MEKLAQFQKGDLDKFVISNNENIISSTPSDELTTEQPIISI